MPAATAFLNRSSDLLFAAARFAAAAAGEPEEPFKASRDKERGFGAVPKLPSAAGADAT